MADDPAEILEAINDRAITRLAVVDGPAEEVTHHWKEPATALDRLVSAFAYDASGRVARGDVEITATDRRALINTSIILHPKVAYAEQHEARVQAGARVLPANEVVISTDYVGDFPAEVREAVIGQRRASDTADGVRETYRRIETAALRMLHARSAIVQVTVSRPGDRDSFRALHAAAAPRWATSRLTPKASTCACWLPLPRSVPAAHTGRGQPARSAAAQRARTRCDCLGRLRRPPALSTSDGSVTSVQGTPGISVASEPSLTTESVRACPKGAP